MPRKLNHKTRRSVAPKPDFGKSVSFSQRHTARQFKPNLQWVTVDVNGKRLRLKLSARQIRSLSNGKPSKTLWEQLRKLA